MKNTNVYHLPDGFKINTVPPDYSLSIDLMDVNVNYQQKDNVVQIDSAYATKRAMIPIERYNLVKEFRAALAKKSDQYIVFKKTSDISSEAKDFINKK